MDNKRDVIVVGGGLSGLAAAYELEQLGVSYTLIEVKPRLGGSIVTVKQAGFIMDGGVFAFPRPDSWPTLDALGLSDALYTISPDTDAGRVAFKTGTQTLTDALAAKLTAPILHRMAVSSIGPNAAGNGYAVCLENGLAFEARAVIVATPARYAERILRNLSPEVSESLNPYYYDHVVRVALGYRGDNRPDEFQMPPNMLFASLNTTDHPARVPDGGLLVQAGVRAMWQEDIDTPRFVELLTESMGWPAPDTFSVHLWAEADPLTVTGPPRMLHRANEHLPETVRLVGNCYRPLLLHERTALAREAARHIAAAL